MSSEQLEIKDGIREKEIKDGICEEEKVKKIYIKWLDSQLNSHANFLNDELTEKKIDENYILYINRLEQEPYYVTHVFGQIDNQIITVFEACDVYKTFKNPELDEVSCQKAFIPLVLKHIIIKHKKRRYYFCDIYNLIVSLQGELDLEDSDNDYLDEVKQVLIDYNIIEDSSKKK